MLLRWLLLCLACTIAQAQNKKLDDYFNMPVGLEKTWSNGAVTIVTRNYIENKVRIIIVEYLKPKNFGCIEYRIGAKTVTKIHTYEGKIICDHGIVFKVPITKGKPWDTPLGKRNIIGDKWIPINKKLEKVKVVDIRTYWYYYAKKLGNVLKAPLGRPATWIKKYRIVK